MKETREVSDAIELAEQKRKLLEYLLEEEGIGVGESEAIARTRLGDHFPVSFAQQRLWFLDQFEQGSPTYNVPAAVRLSGKLDVEALEQSINQIVRRHEVLRTRFSAVDGEPVQVIAAEVELTLRVADLTELAGEVGPATALRLAEQNARLGFDLSEAPLVRATLLRVARDHHVLLLTMHHIISDGWSLGVILGEVAAFYQRFITGGKSSLPDVTIQYKDFACWEREWLQGEAFETELKYWKNQLGGELPVVAFPTDHPRPPFQTYRGGFQTCLLPEGLVGSVNQLCRQEEATLFMTLLAAFNVLVYRYTGQEDVVVGTPIANRNRDEVEGLIGFFANSLVMRTDMSGDPTFRQLLARVREVALGAYAHQEMPFEKLVEELLQVRDLSHTPLFQVMFVLQNAPIPDIELPGLKLSPINVGSGTAKFDLILSIGDSPEGLRATVEYNTDLFESQTAIRLLEHYGRLVESITSNPDERISRLSLLDDDERLQLVERWNDAEPGAGLHDTLVHLFEQQVDRTPFAVAVSFEDQSLTYWELNRRANKLAHYLGKRGAGPESLVGICTERSGDMVVGMLAILKAGAAYVPLDPLYPKERRSLILDDSQVSLVVTQELLANHFGDSPHPLCIDRDWKVIDKECSCNPQRGLDEQNPAYVIYTSGSTGKPKGVVVSHHNVARLFEAARDSFEFSERDVWTVFHTYAFDFSVWELWGALTTGGRAVIVPFWVSRSPEAFYELLHSEAVTVLNQTPSAFRQLIQVEEKRPARLHLRLVVFGGEALEVKSLRPWFNRHGDEEPQLINMYGITETTVHVTRRRITRDDLERVQVSPIGGTLRDLRLYLLDRHQEPVPVAVAGEICVAGPGLARGYLNQPALTAERFLPDPWTREPGRRLYRSGDAARRLIDGEVEYLGRIDQQVKVRGFRIEPGEIQAALNAHPQVRESIVIARKDASDEKRLVAYVTAATGAEPSVDELRRYLKDRLPDYMVPAAILIVDSLPLTPHGKVDRRALPIPDWSRRRVEEAFIPPRNAVEEALAAVWSAVLGVERVGVNDNYFGLGGDSILSIRVRARAREKGLDFSLQQLFQHQTIRGLAAHTKTVSSEPASGDQSARGAATRLRLLTERDRARVPDYVEDAYQLSELQAGMVFHSEYSADYLTYVTSFHLRLPFDAEKLQLALDQMVAVHEMLRTSFDGTNYSEPLQLVHRDAHLPLVVEDLRRLSPAEQAAYIDEWLEAEKRRKFDWAAAPLLRIRVHLRSGDSIQFTMTEPFFDGWSVASFLTELFERYFALLGDGPRPECTALEARYRDFVELEREALSSEECRVYWSSRLADATGCRLPRRLTENPRELQDVVRLPVPVPADISDGLKEVAQSAGVSLKSVLLAAHLKVVSVLSGQEDAITGLLINGRPEKTDGERLLGTFLNTVPLRMNLRGGTWLDLVRRASEAENELLPFRRYPIQELQRLYEAERLFDTIFNYTHFHVMDRLRGMTGLEVFGQAGSEQTYFALTAQFNVDNETLRVRLELDYRTIDLGADQVVQIAGYYTRVLEAMAGDSRAAHDLRCLSSEKELRLLTELNDTRLPFSERVCAHELFERLVERFPDATALVFGDKVLCYRALRSLSNRLACRLQRMGVGPEVAVGICLERSLEMIVAVFAVLKAGGFYIPLDPEYPVERLRFMIEDSGAGLVITQDRLVEHLSEAGAHILRLDSEWQDVFCESDRPPAVKVTPSNLAYVIYTSGSTGKPKGVLIEHRGLTNVIESSISRFEIGNSSRVMQLASLNFDASALEIFTALLSGASLHLSNRDIAASPSRLAGMLREEAITSIAIVPSVLELVPPGDFGSLSAIVLGGEACSPDLAMRWSKGRRLFNVYAPTEATIYATSMRFDGDERVAPPIGRPIANMQAHVFGPDLHPAPMGVSGELYIGGVGVARGYLNRPDLSADAFVPDALTRQPGARLYRTGDLSRWREDGNLEFLGRVDHQLKIRGFRIEPGEIEAVLLEHPDVKETVVVAGEDRPGEKRLIAYLVADGNRAINQSDLRTFLKKKLPDYMTPGAYVFMDSMPLTATGKIDRRALPPPDSERPHLSQAYVAPRTPIEEMLAAIWAETLGLDRVGIQDDFFDLGGHSLAATRVISRARIAFEIELQLRALFENPSIEDLAGVIEELIKGGLESKAEPIRAARRDQGLPLSFAQQRLWFLDQFEPGSPLYNIATAVCIAGPLDLPVLERSIGEIVRRHESLRTTFSIDGSRPVQVIGSQSEVILTVADLRNGLGDRQREAMRLAAAEARRPFDLEKGPLIRTTILQLEDEAFWLLFTMHHIISDGWSMGVLIQELGSVYEACRQGRPSPLPELTIQYADFAVWQREWLKGPALERQLEHWRGRLAGSPPKIDLPTDRPRPPVQTFNGAVEPFALGSDLTAKLRKLSREEGVTLFMALLAVFDGLIYRYTGQQDILVGTPVANRNRVDVEGIIGFFVNTVVIRTNLCGDPAFRELLHRVREASLAAYAHQDLPFEKLVEELNPPRELSHSPLFQIMLDLQSSSLHGLRLTGLSLRPLVVENRTAKFDLTLTMADGEDELSAALEYNTDLFEPATIRRMLRHFEALLEGALGQPGAPINLIPLLSDAETHQLLVGWNDTRAEYPTSQSVCELFDEQASRNPDRVAIAYADELITFSGLSTRAGKLAAYLRRIGVGPESLVGVCLERSAELIVAIMGALKAGAAYVPLDPSAPRARLDLLLRESKIEVVLTDERVFRLIGQQDATMVLLDRDREIIAREDANVPPARVEPENAAYLIFTSGSTGRPKGVMVPHRALINSTLARLAYYDEPVRAFLLLSPVVFDSSVAGIFWTLCHGGMLVIPDEDSYADPSRLSGLIAANRVSHLLTLPSLYSALLRQMQARESSPLRLAIVAGEACSRDVVQEHTRVLAEASLFNEYGPTEAAVWSTAFDCHVHDRSSRVPIGRPISNVQVYLLDPGLQPVPPGVTAEVFIGGMGLARGYLGHPHLTAERFIPSPFAEEPGSRLYQTGDLGRLSPKGEIEFLGRNDHQVKIRGMRIELGEIETVLEQHEKVGEAAVAARMDGPKGDTRLVAYVTTKGRHAPEEKELREYLRQRLPYYMTPANYVALESFPLMPSGKVDRSKLPEPEREDEERGFEAPRSEVEKAVAAIWEDVLARKRIGLNENFFEIGGHSLLATQVMSRVNEVFGEGFGVRKLFEEPTVRGLAAAIVKGEQVGENRKGVARAGELLLGLPEMSVSEEEPSAGGKEKGRRIRRALGVAAGHAQTFEIGDKKRELLEVLLAEEGMAAKGQRIPRRGGDGPVALSFAQQRLWFFDQFEPGSPLYNLLSGVSLKGRLDVAALQRSFDEVVRRHETLRTTFKVIEGRPVQVIGPPEPLRLEMMDLRSEAAQERASRIQRMFLHGARRPFDLRQGPLLRVSLARIDQYEHVMMLAMHHIVSDAWSMGIFVREMTALYDAFSNGRLSPLPDLSIQYADFAVWQREWLQGETLEVQLSFWKEQLSGELPVLELPSDRPRPALQTYNGVTVTFDIPEDLARSLRSLSQGEGATPFMTLLSVYSVLLHRYTGHEDLAIGAPIANRNRADIEPLIGFFTNTLVIRTDLSGKPTFKDLLARVKQVALDAYSHQDLPFEYLVEQLHPDRDLSHSPLVQVMLAMENILADEIRIPGLVVTPVEGESTTSKFDQAIYVRDSGAEMQGAIEYNTDLFDRETVLRTIGHLLTLLESVTANRLQRIEDLSLLTAREKEQLLVEWNSARRDYPALVCAHELFEAQAEKRPEGAAVVLDGAELSYRELNRRADQLACHLRALGVSAGSPVGVYMRQSFEMVISVLGILKAGACCLPLDPSYPTERLSFMLDDSRASVVLSQEALAHAFPATAAQIVHVDSDETLREDAGENVAPRALPEQWAYVIYTSGSTGRPKGVAMTHRALVNLAHWQRMQSSWRPRTLQYASLNFDVSFQEMFATWHAGGTLFLITEDLRADVPALGALIERHGVERFHLPVAVLQKLSEEFHERPGVLSSLREMMVGGEQLQISPPITQLFSQLTNCSLHNHYGPSETHVVTSHPLPADPAAWPRLPALGRPIHNTEIYLVDGSLNPVPVGVAGEICIGGICLAPGYLARAEMTAQRFIPNPFAREPGSRLYKTGDVARYLGNGDIDFLGRNDFQVKIRGMRIELGEIEAVLRQHPQVREAAVTLRADGPGGDKRLVAYVTAQQAPSGRELREFLKRTLPEHMVPSVYVALDTMPLTPSGKVDRLRLPEPDLTGYGEKTYEAPATPVEKVLAGIWEEVLGRERVGLNDHFFELGGHSLLATQVMSRVREVFDEDVGLKKLFENPTIEGLAEAIVGGEGRRERAEKRAEIHLRLSELSDEQVESLLSEKKRAK